MQFIDRLDRKIICRVQSIRGGMIILASTEAHLGEEEGQEGGSLERIKKSIVYLFIYLNKDSNDKHFYG